MSGRRIAWFGSIVLAAMVAALACSTGTKSPRKISSVEEARVVPRDFAQAIRDFRELVASDRLNRTTCGPVLGKIFAELFNDSATYFDQEVVAARAREIVEEGFLARLELRKKFGTMVAEGPVDTACVDSMRDVFRAIRFAEEYVAEWILKPGPSDHALRGDFPSLMINPAYNGKFEFRSGDVMVSRGNAVASAAIARIGDRGGQFSHLAMVYIDEKTQVPYVVEAHIEIGTKVTTLEKYMTDGKLRAVLYRQPDAMLAHRAAKTMYERAIKATASGKNIPYDFGMNMDDASEIFCSEVPYWGYRLASKDQIVLPMFRTGMHMKDRRFLGAIGVKTDTTFAPSDMEVEPRFEIVAEWRDFSKTANARMLDAILSEMYQWMDDYGYAFHNTLGQRFMKNLGWILRHLPLFEHLVEKKFPKNMKRSMLGVMMSLGSVVGAILKELHVANDEFIKTHGVAMASKDMREFINHFREVDFEQYQKWLQYDSSPQGDNVGVQPPAPEMPKFHIQFHPTR